MRTVIKHGDKCLEGICPVQYSLGSKDWAEVTEGKHLATAELAAAHIGEIAANPSTVILPEKWVQVLTGANMGCSNAADLLTTAKLKGFDAVPADQAALLDAAVFDDCLTLLERIGTYDPQNAPRFE